MSTTIKYINTIHLTIDNDGKYESVTLRDKMYEKMITIPVEVIKNVFGLLNQPKVNFVADSDTCYISVEKFEDTIIIINLIDSTKIELLYSEYKADFEHLLQIL